MSKTPQAATRAEFTRLLARAQQRLGDHVAAYQAHQDPEALVNAVTATLTRAHTRAAYLGRYRAGDQTPPDVTDTAYADAVMVGEQYFLARLQGALAAGRYAGKPEALQARLQMYLGRVTATANEAWALTSEGEIRWLLGEAEHCPDCVALSRASPYTWATLPTVPRAGHTECLFNCACRLLAADGTTSF